MAFELKNIPPTFPPSEGQLIDCCHVTLLRIAYRAVNKLVTEHAQFRIDAFGPEPHLHITKQRHGGDEMSPRISIHCGTPVQGTEAQMTPSREWPQPKLLRLPHGLPIEVFGLRDVEGFMLRGHFGYQPKRPALQSLFVSLTCAAQRLVSKLRRLSDRPRQETCFTQPHDHLRVEDGRAHARRLIERLAE
jgi:hypothetical protein